MIRVKYAGKKNTYDPSCVEKKSNPNKMCAKQKHTQIHEQNTIATRLANGLLHLGHYKSGIE